MAENILKSIAKIMVNELFTTGFNGLMTSMSGSNAGGYTATGLAGGEHLGIAQMIGSIFTKAIGGWASNGFSFGDSMPALSSGSQSVSIGAPDFDSINSFGYSAPSASPGYTDFDVISSNTGRFSAPILNVTNNAPNVDVSIASYDHNTQTVGLVVNDYNNRGISYGVMKS